MSKEGNAHEPDAVWSEHDASTPGDTVCKLCGSEAFRAATNAAGSLKLECVDCHNAVAYCWSDESGNNLLQLEPRTAH